MIETPLALAEQYTSSLTSYLAGGGEAALERAYELGRRALAEGLGVLDMAAIYHRSLAAVLQRAPAFEESRARLKAAADFFAESLSPFEMTQRGTQEAYASLRQMNESLARRAKELNRANIQLARAVKEHKRAEEQVRKLNVELENRAVELEAINKELEAFSYSVSHDLRAPLRSIDGFSQALLEDYGDTLDEAGKDYLHRVRAASQRMAQLIDDMLNLSRVTRSEIHRETVDLSALARSVAAELQQMQPERVVEFVIAEGLVAEGDARLLRVVLENLLGNAWKFTGKRQQARIEFGVQQSEGRPAYFVRDNGAGFDMAYAEKLFGAFQRLHAMTEFTGTGIGLATVQRIVHRHGGRVWAEGAVNQGATIYFTL